MLFLFKYFNTFHILEIQLYLFALLTQKSSEEPSCNYPLSKRLNNGNYLLICSTGIYFYDSELQNKINSINTNTCESECVHSTTYSQFLEEDDGYIIVFQNGINYIFSENGEYISNITISYFTLGKPYTIIAYEHSEHFYYFAIIYTNSVNIYFKKYQFNSISKEILLNNTYDYTSSDTLNIAN